MMLHHVGEGLADNIRDSLSQVMPLDHFCHEPPEWQDESRTNTKLKVPNCVYRKGKELVSDLSRRRCDAITVDQS